MDAGRTKNFTDILYGVSYALSKCNSNVDHHIRVLYKLTDILSSSGTISVSMIEDSVSNIFDETDTKISTGDVLVYISPVSFYSAYDYDGCIANIVKQICSIFIDDDALFNIAIEYVRLLHDILFNRITELDDILLILPELDINQSEIIVASNAHDSFFAGLWSFVFSKSYDDAINRALSFENCPASIFGITGALASLYYGIDSVPLNWIVEFNSKFIEG